MTLHDFGFPLTYSEECERSKADIREENDRLIAEFLARGGHIQQVATGVSGIGLVELPIKEVLRMPSWKRREYYRKMALKEGAAVLDIELQDEHVARVETMQAEQEVVDLFGGAK